MRLVFLGQKDDYGFMAHISGAINNTTDVVSNCIVYENPVGYFSDLVIHRKKKRGEYISLTRELATDFISQADTIIFNDTITKSQICSNFGWKDIQVNDLISGKIKIAFLSDIKKFYNNRKLLIETYDTYAKICNHIFTNQPFIFLYLRESGRKCKFVTQPLGALTRQTQPFLTVGVKVLYRPYITVGDEEDAFSDMLNFLYNELQSFSFLKTRKQPYTTSCFYLQSTCVTADGLIKDVVTMPMIEGVSANHVVFTNINQEIFEMMKQDGLFSKNILNQEWTFKELYEKMKRMATCGYAIIHGNEHTNITKLLGDIVSE